MVSCRDLLSYIGGESEEDRKRAACKNLAAGLLLGAAVGVAAGILLAPRAGRETRRAIAEKTTDAIDSLHETLSEYREGLVERLENIGHEKRDLENGESQGWEPAQPHDETGTS